MVAGPTIRSGPTGGIATAAVTSASFTPTANSFVLVIVGSTGASGATNTRATTDLSSTHSGGTFGAWGLYQQPSVAGTQCATYVFYAFAGASPGAGTITVTLGAAPTEANITILEFTGVDTTTPVGAAATAGSTSGSQSVTVPAAPVAADYLFGAATTRNLNGAMTVGSGFTQAYAYFKAAPSASVTTEYKTGVTTTTVDISGGGTAYTTLVGFVIKNASAGATPKHKVHTGAGLTNSIRKVYNGSTWTDTVSSIR